MEVVQVADIFAVSIPKLSILAPNGFLLRAPHLSLLVPPRNFPATLRRHHLRQPAKNGPAIRPRRPEFGAGPARPRRPFRRCRRHFCSQQVRLAKLRLWRCWCRIEMCLCISSFSAQVTRMVSVYG